MEYPIENESYTKLLVEPIDTSMVILNNYGLSKKINELIDKHNKLVEIIDEFGLIDEAEERASLEEEDDGTIDAEESETVTNDIIFDTSTT